MKGRWAALAAVLLCACAGPGSSAGIGASMSAGTGLVPIGVSGGTSTAITYREHGGVVSRTLLRVLVALSAAPRTRTEVTTDRSVSCGGGACVETVRTTTTTYVLDSPEEIAAKAAAANRAMAAIGSSEVPMTFELDVFLPSMGGDTSGYMTRWLYQGQPHLTDGAIVSAVQLSGGIGLGSMRFHDRLRTRLTENGSMLSASQEEVPSIGYGYFGMPFRVDLAVGHAGLFTRAQADFNLLAWIDNAFDDDPTSPDKLSPYHFGLGFRRGPVEVLGTAVVSRLSGDGITGQLEAALVF